jgi:regulatory protein
MPYPSRSSSARTPSGTALDAALVILAQRPHAASELRWKLRRKGHEPDQVESALARLGELGYLDDGAFARTLVSWRSSKRGRRAIASELAQRGVPREQAEAALAELDPDSEAAAARWVAAPALRSGDAASLARAAAKLRRRGFSEAVIRAVLLRASVEAEADRLE